MPSLCNLGPWAAGCRGPASSDGGSRKQSNGPGTTTCAPEPPRVADRRPSRRDTILEYPFSDTKSTRQGQIRPLGQKSRALPLFLPKRGDLSGCLHKPGGSNGRTTFQDLLIALLTTAILYATMGPTSMQWKSWKV